MPEPRKPCIRCEGTGVVKVEIIESDPHIHLIVGMFKCRDCRTAGAAVVEEDRVLEEVG